ncbi:MAG: hypothetical protein EA350_16575 [Gemmatimonadales bacterium]|nr:MAG: hypothetical protein EA350_16575 [Gemmatimonadales bacterium]
MALGLVFALMVGACGGDSDAAEGPEGQDPTSDETVGAEAPRGSAGAAAPPATSPAAPSATPRTPATSSAAPAASAPALPSGTLLVFEVTETVSTSTHKAGDPVSLRLVRDVRGDNGALIPAGATARGVVTDSRESRSAEEEAVLGIRISSVQVSGTQQNLNGRIESTDLKSEARDSGQRSVAKVATGAAAGAIIGQVIGRDTRSTVTGAAAGAAAGLGIALTTRDGHAVLAQGSQVTVRLDSPMVVN